MKYRCRECGAVYNLSTGTVWSGTHYDCWATLMVLRGIARGVPTLQLAEELDLDYSALLGRRHQIQKQALEGGRTGLPDQVVEADEMLPAEISADAGENMSRLSSGKPIRTLTLKTRLARGQTNSTAGAPTKTTVRRRSGWWTKPAERFG